MMGDWEAAAKQKGSAHTVENPLQVIASSGSVENVTDPRAGQLGGAQAQVDSGSNSAGSGPCSEGKGGHALDCPHYTGHPGIFSEAVSGRRPCCYYRPKGQSPSPA